MIDEDDCTLACKWLCFLGSEPIKNLLGKKSTICQGQIKFMLLVFQRKIFGKGHLNKFFPLNVNYTTDSWSTMTPSSSVMGLRLRTSLSFSPGQHFWAAQFSFCPHARTHSVSFLSSQTNSGWIVVEWMPSLWKNLLILLAMLMYSSGDRQVMWADADQKISKKGHIVDKWYKNSMFDWPYSGIPYSFN